jgi:hypothetical protein
VGAADQRALHTWPLHFGSAAGQSSSLSHSTQDASLQIFAVAGQSLLVWHVTHLPLLVQSGRAAGQSAGRRHSTHAARAVSHFGVEPLHWVSLVQPGARHLRSSTSQVGVAAGQSLFVRQATHSPRRTSHRGAAAPHWVESTHATQVCVVAEQKGLPVALLQSVFVLQPTHAPVVVLQMRAEPGQLAGEVQAAWHL